MGILSYGAGHQKYQVVRWLELSAPPADLKGREEGLEIDPCETLEQQDSGSLLVDEHFEVLGGLCTQRGHEISAPLPPCSPCASLPFGSS